MSDYSDALAKLQAFYDRLVQETDSGIPMIHSYELPTRDLVAVLLPLFKALAPK